MAVDAHLRRRKTAKTTAWRGLEARLNVYRMFAKRLFEEIDLLADQRIPTFDPLEVDAAGAARLVRMQWRLPIGPVRSLVRWLEAAGCVVIEEDFGTPRIDGLSQWVDEHPVILVNLRAPTDRKRLTLAHELGHLCLHSAEVSEHMESEADAFAAEFLMPTEVISSQLRNVTLGRLHDLKREWGVSMQALVERAHGAGLVTTAERTNLYKGMSARGWRTREPLGDVLPPETPSLTREIGDALAARGLSPGDIAALVGVAGPAHPHPFQPTTKRLRAVTSGSS
jgi:Zn-dependent peptidase ImmA (M78 family)